MHIYLPFFCPRKTRRACWDDAALTRRQGHAENTVRKTLLIVRRMMSLEYQHVEGKKMSTGELPSSFMKYSANSSRSP